jgi:branched-chain amino acid transport system substrate-binding protein
MRRILLCVALLGVTSCSIINGSGFNECDNDTTCKDNQACLEHFCIDLTPGCRRVVGVFDATDRINFAAVLPLTDVPDAGTVDQSEQQGLNALTLALEEGNQRDGIKGKKFALFLCNTGGDDALAKQEVEWMADNLKVPAVITSGSGQSIAVTNVAAPKNVMVMSATSTSPELISVFQTSNHLLWRTAPSDAIQARVITDVVTADFAGSPTARVAILYINTTYGQGLAGALRPKLDAVKGTTADGGVGASKFTVTEVQYNAADDFTTPVNLLNTFDPDLTVMVGFPPEIRDIVNLAKAKPNLSKAAGHRWLFTDSAKDPAILEDGTLSELAGSVGTAPAQGDGATFPSFRDRFQVRFKADPSDFSFTSHSYDAMYLTMLAAAWATGNGGTLSGGRMADGMLHMSAGSASPLEPSGFSSAVNSLQSQTGIDVEGASGKLNFDPDAGAPPSRYELWTVEADAGFSSIIVEPTGT